MLPQNHHEGSPRKAYPEGPSTHDRGAQNDCLTHVLDLQTQWGPGTDSISSTRGPSPLRVQPVTTLEVDGSRAQTSLSAVEEPDFVREERQAWARYSPIKSDQVFQLQLRQESLQPREEASTYEPADTSLRVFRPAVETCDIHSRPKTSRGPTSNHQPLSQDAQEPEVHALGQSGRLRKSNFVEGSMTEQSRAVASSWDDQTVSGATSKTPDAPNFGATSRLPASPRSDSIDLREFQPVQPTGSTLADTIRHMIRRPKLTSSGSLETGPRPVVESEMLRRPRKGLRKSISSWNLFGERMRIFGGSTATLSSDPTATQPHCPDVKTVLDDRKRKAEKVYAEQFGTKKRKDNSGAAATAAATTLYDEQNATSTVRKRPRPEASTPRARSSTRRRRSSSIDSRSTICTNAAATRVDPVSAGTIPTPTRDGLDDCHPRSRIELEEENECLHVSLGQSDGQDKSQNKQPSENWSTFGNAELGGQKDGSRSLDVERSTTPSPVRRSHRYRVRADSDGVPPVPPLPTNLLRRSTLAPLTSTMHVHNSKSTSPNEQPPSTKWETRLNLDRPVSTILEEKENELDSNDTMEYTGASSKLHETQRITRDPIKTDEAWQWPDDVF